MIQFINQPIVSGILSGVVSGLILAFIVARVPALQEPKSGDQPSDSHGTRTPDKRVTVYIQQESRIEVRHDRSNTDGDSNDKLAILVVGLIVAVSLFATYIEFMTRILLTASIAVSVALICAIIALLIARIRIVGRVWTLFICGTAGAGIGVSCAVLITGASIGQKGQGTLTDWVSLLYLMLGWLAATLLVACSAWALLLVLAHTSLALHSRGRRMWAFLARRTPPMWAYCLATLMIGALAVALSSGWALEFIKNSNFTVDLP